MRHDLVYRHVNEFRIGVGGGAHADPTGCMLRNGETPGRIGVCIGLHAAGVDQVLDHQRCDVPIDIGHLPLQTRHDQLGDQFAVLRLIVI